MIGFRVIIECIRHLTSSLMFKLKPCDFPSRPLVFPAGRPAESELWKETGILH